MSGGVAAQLEAQLRAQAGGVVAAGQQQVDLVFLLDASDGVTLQGQ